jgi:hypothetical protein
MKPMRLVSLVGLALLLSLAADAVSQDKKKPDVFTDPKEAGVEYQIQGEYLGTLGKEKFGGEVIAKGNGNYVVNFVPGGLRGAGGDQDKIIATSAKTVDSKVALASKDGKWTGTIEAGKLTGKSADGAEFALEKTERKSPTLGAKPPQGAIVLFDGSNADKWGGGKIVEENLLFCGTNSKDNLPVGKLHIEFRSAFQPKAGGQGRGNSGVYIWGKEIQVLDSFGLKCGNGDCAAYYGEKIPDVNMCLPPLSWQTYDVEFKVGEKGTLVATVLHNGVKVHDNYDIKVKPSAAGQKINLQNHGDPVAFRNIWYVPLEQTK